MKHDEIDPNGLEPEKLARLVLAQRAFIGVKVLADAKLAQIIDQGTGVTDADLKGWRQATAEVLDKYDQSIAEILGRPAQAKGH